MSIWKWANWLPPVDAQSRVTLGEGNTPLIRSRSIGPALGLPNLFFKLETTNPTGSYKDRFAAAAVSDLLAHEKRLCLATSSGNTGAALAAYCAAAKIDCMILILETTPDGKLSQMLAYGARLTRVRGFGSDPDINTEVFERLEKIAQLKGCLPMISAFRYCPLGMAGVQTISYELNQQAKTLGIPIDHVFVPAGGGGLTLAVAKGFQQTNQLEHMQSNPRIECVQPEGNDTIASPLREGSEQARAVTGSTEISGLQVASVIDGDEVISHCRASGGTGHVVTDSQIWKTQQRLAREEGIFCEPAGAVALTGAIQTADEGHFDRGAMIVCLITGSGFKDPTSLERMNSDTEVPTINVDQLEEKIQRGNHTAHFFDD